MFLDITTKLFDIPKIPSSLNYSKEYIEDLIYVYGYLCSDDYLLTLNKEGVNIFDIKELKGRGIEFSTEGFGWTYTNNNQDLFIEYIKQKDYSLNLEDTPDIYLGGLEDVSLIIEDGVCFLWIDEDSYIITYEQYKELEHLKAEKASDFEDKTSNNAPLCPYCGKEITSYTHLRVCTTLRKGTN